MQQQSQQHHHHDLDPDDSYHHSYSYQDGSTQQHQQQQQQQHHYMVAEAGDAGHVWMDEPLADAEPDQEDERPRHVSLPDESELVLLCLDYLRDLRRSFPKKALSETEQVNANYLTLACWALTRSLESPVLKAATSTGAAVDGTNNHHHNNHQNAEQQPEEEEDGNDAWFDPTKQTSRTKSIKLFSAKHGSVVLETNKPNHLPSVAEMEDEFLYRKVNPHNNKQNAGPAAHSSRVHQIAETQSGLEIVNAATDKGLHSATQNASTTTPYDYDDSHPSNAHRFYPLQGLASGPDLPGPLTLGEMVAAGLVGLGARTRRQAEAAFCDPMDETDQDHGILFDNYLQAVRNKGFFDISDESMTDAERNDLIRERYAKVVAKFRVKLASTVLQQQQQQDPQSSEYWAALTAAEQQRQGRETRRMYALSTHSADAEEEYPVVEPEEEEPTKQPAQQQQQQASSGAWFSLNSYTLGKEDEKTDKDSDVNGGGGAASHVGTEASVASYVKRMAFASKLFSVTTSTNINSSKPSLPPKSEKAVPKKNAVASPMSASSSAHHPNAQHPRDLEEAERYKNQGNTYMQHKEYEEAAKCYTKALKLSPAGPQSHVYFSNRAAALVSLRQFEEAISDSERALTLHPNYSKAHARLGLAYFLMGSYEMAKESYERALELEPNNKSNQSYLEKANHRLAEQQQQQQQHGDSKSFSNRKTPRSPNSESVKSVSTSSLKEAEKYKTRGNSLMASRDYEKALEAYTHALQCSSQGPQSHVYYSNRAAALCYLERYQEAESDSLKSLELDPTYGKAHARLGLSRFFLHDYSGAISAYTSALEYDPNNAASQSYLQKAKAKLAKRQARDDHQHAPANTTTSNKGSPKLSVNTKSARSQSNGRPSAGPVSPPRAPIPDITARRLLHDDNLRSMATRAMANPSSKDLLNDPDMHELSKRAMKAMRK